MVTDSVGRWAWRFVAVNVGEATPSYCPTRQHGMCVRGCLELVRSRGDPSDGTAMPPGNARSAAWRRLGTGRPSARAVHIGTARFGSAHLGARLGSAQLGARQSAARPGARLGSTRTGARLGPARLVSARPGARLGSSRRRGRCVRGDRGRVHARLAYQQCAVHTGARNPFGLASVSVWLHTSLGHFSGGNWP